MKEETTQLEDMQHKISELEHLVKTLEQKNLEQEEEICSLKEKVQQQTLSVDRFKSRDSDFEFYTGFCNYSTFKAFYFMIIFVLFVKGYSTLDLVTVQHKQ